MGSPRWLREAAEPVSLLEVECLVKELSWLYARIDVVRERLERARSCSRWDDEPDAWSDEPVSGVEGALISAHPLVEEVVAARHPVDDDLDDNEWDFYGLTSLDHEDLDDEGYAPMVVDDDSHVVVGSGGSDDGDGDTGDDGDDADTDADADGGPEGKGLSYGEYGG